MALTALQRHVCRTLADHRKRLGESYVAGASALNEMIASARRSHDIDLFHDTEAALVATWASDRTELQAAGLRVEPVRELPAFVEARVGDATETVLVQRRRHGRPGHPPLARVVDPQRRPLHAIGLAGATRSNVAVLVRRHVRNRCLRIDVS